MPSTEEVVSLFERLAEGWQERKDTDKDLSAYRNRVEKPEPAPLFQDLDALLDYHQRRLEYVQGLQMRKEANANAVADYEDAAERLVGVLPQGSHVYYDYQGTRKDLRGTRFTIENRHAKIMVLDVVGSTGSSPA